MSALLVDAALAVGLLAVLLAALECGYRAGRREARDVHPIAGAQIGMIQGAKAGARRVLEADCMPELVQ